MMPINSTLCVGIYSLVISSPKALQRNDQPIRDGGDNSEKADTLKLID